MLATVPPDRLLVVRTDQISQRIGDIADFVGIDAASLDTSRSHTFEARRKHGVLALVERDFLEDKVQQHCGQLMKLYFPEIRGDCPRFS